jgi:hypothetical protein
MPQLTNDELTKLRSRLYRGYRAPQAVSEFFHKERILSMTTNAAGNVEQMIQQVEYEDGTTVTKTTDFVYDGSGVLQSNTVTYTYDDTTP